MTDCMYCGSRNAGERIPHSTVVFKGGAVLDFCNDMCRNAYLERLDSWEHVAVIDGRYVGGEEWQ